MKIAIVGSRKYENKRKIKDFVFDSFNLLIYGHLEKI